MKVEKLIFGAVLIVWGVITFVYYWTLGFFGPIAALICAIPMMVIGVLMMFLGAIQGKADEMGRSERALLILFILASVLTLMAFSLIISSYYGIVGLFLIVIGIILAPPSKRRMWQLILSAIVVIIMIIIILLIMSIPPPVAVPPPP